MPLRIGPVLDRVARLLLGADEEHGAALAGDLGGEVARLVEQLLGLQQVDDVDPVALAVDVTAHARVPAPASGGRSAGPPAAVPSVRART